MLRVTFVATAAAYLARSSVYIAAGANPEAKCELGKGTATTPLVTYGAITIVCPADSTLQGKVDGSGKHTYVLSSDQQDASPLELPKVVPGASFVVQQEGGATAQNVLTVRQLPPKLQSVFFLCQGDGADPKRCYIRVDISASPLLGPNTCVVPDSQVDFTASSEGSVVKFSCGSQGTLHPQDAAKVFDESCKQQVDVGTVVPGAACERPAEVGGMTSVTFPKLPSRKQKLCFLCIQDGDHRCKVTINVTRDDESAAVEVTARTALSLGVTAAAAGLLHFL